MSYQLFAKYSRIYSFYLSFTQLAIDVIHNMRTIKQLSVEKEIIHKYKELMDQVVMLVHSVLYMYIFFQMILLLP